MRALALLLPLAVVVGCDLPRVEQARAPAPPEPPAALVPPPSGHPSADFLRSAHDPTRVPADFLALWNAAVGHAPTSRYGDFVYHVAASGDRSAAVLVPWNADVTTPLLMGHRIHAVEESFTIDVSRVPRVSERKVSTRYGPAFAFDALDDTYKVVALRTQQRPPRNRAEALTLLVWREAQAARKP